MVPNSSKNITRGDKEGTSTQYVLKIKENGLKGYSNLIDIPLYSEFVSDDRSVIEKLTISNFAYNEISANSITFSNLQEKQLEAIEKLISVILTELGNTESFLNSESSTSDKTINGWLKSFARLMYDRYIIHTMLTLQNVAPDIEEKKISRSI